MLQPKAYVFDAFGTLFDTTSVLARCEETFPGQGPELTALWRSKQLEYSWLRCLMGRYEDFWTLTRDGLTFACHALHLRIDQDRLDHLLEGYFTLEPFPDTAVLTRLGDIPRAILSNGSPTMLNAVVSNSGLTSRFQHVLSVDAVKSYKPSPDAYRIATDCLGLEAKDIVFVSSNGWDVAGAASFGFRACWLNRQNAPLEMLGQKPEAIIRTLGDLVP
jgi:2-haloacid dehalogenase